MILKNKSSRDFFEFLQNEIKEIMAEISNDFSGLILYSDMDKKEHRQVSDNYDPFTITKESVYLCSSMKAELIYTASYSDEHHLESSSASLFIYNDNKKIGDISSAEKDQGIEISFTFEDPEVRGKIENIIKGRIC